MMRKLPQGREIKTSVLNSNSKAGNPVKKIRILDSICYLVPCREGYILVDTGYPGKWKFFQRKLGKTGVSITEIKYILLTHHHNDHAGLVNEIREKSGARLIVHKDEVEPLAKGISLVGKPVNLFTRIAKMLYSLLTDYSYSPVQLQNDDYVVDGDDSIILKTLGCDGIILHTPGHTKGSISILLSQGIVIAGDVVMNQSRLFFSSPKPIIIDNIDEIYASWKKLKTHGARLILPSHGKEVPIEALN